MSLSTGTRLGPYEILTPLGAGGMGEVYKARDTRLDRTVAIKVLPEHLSQKPQLRERFEREARAVSSLNHSNICTLHDVGQQDGVDYLVMEYLEGDTLSQRLKKGPLPLDQTLRYTIEIASALDHAHRHGVVHRDLKPGNIMLTKAGAKVLDFGLAKIHASTARPDVTQPTNTMTEEGVILGTLQYMAPEQLAGEEADARSDIFAFGTVVYEMATGKKAFEGKSRASVIAAILEREPPPLTTLDPMTPAALDRVLKKCLAKDPDRRWQSAQDLNDELQWIAEGGSQADGPAPGLVVKNRGLWAWITAAVFAVIAVLALFAYFTKRQPEGAVTRFSFSPPFKTDFVQLAVSPDGRRVVFAGPTANGFALWLRPLNSLTAQQLPGTENGGAPFWSPDGRFIGFTADGKLKKVDVGQGQNSVQTICSPAMNLAGAWNAEGVILFQPEVTGTGLYRVPASGGAPVPATQLSSARQEITHRYPQFLPDGRHFLYFVWSASEEYSGIYIGSLDPREKLTDRGPLVRTWRAGVYAQGYLLFLQGSTLMAQRFDADRQRFGGDPQGLPERISTGFSGTGQAIFALSTNGALAYQEAAPLPGSRVVWLERTGKQIREIEAPRGSRGPSLAPDGARLALTVDNEQDIEDIWVIALERGTSTRLTATHGSSINGAWSPDGRRIAFQSNRSGVYDLYGKHANGVGDEELLVKSLHIKQATGWSQDGRFLVYLEYDPKTGADIWVLPLEGDHKPFPFLKTEFNESGTPSPVLDSHGRLWMAYDSDETGRAEIYVRPFEPDAPAGPAGAKMRVSTGGGFDPRWRKDGRELFYGSLDGKVMAVDVTLGSSAEIGVPHKLFDIPPDNTGWAPFADGRRFLFIEPAGEPPAAKINVVLNWQAELKR